MLAFTSLIIVLVLSFFTGSVFRKRFKENHLSSCLAMFVTMTKSTLIGIVVAIWVPDMVLSTILAMVLSLLCIVMMTYKLSIKVFIESLGALFMGSMMGAMLSLMTTNYTSLGITFFTIIYILSCLAATGLWNKEQYPHFFKAIPLEIITIATFSILILVAALLQAAPIVPANNHEIEKKIEVEHDHH